MTKSEIIKALYDSNLNREILTSLTQMVNQSNIEAGSVTPYNHDSKNVHLACGLSENDNNEFLDKVKEAVNGRGVSSYSEYVEAIETVAAGHPNGIRLMALLFILTMAQKPNTSGLDGMLLKMLLGGR